MSWEKVKLQKIIHKPISGEWGNEGNSIKIIRTTNFTNNGRLNLHEVVTRDIALTKVNKKKLVKGDTIIEKSGGSPTQPVGRVVYFNEDDLYLCNNFTSVIRPKENVNGKYLFWFLFNNHISKKTLKYQNKTTGIINLKLENYINEVEIPLPPLPIQEKIAAILDKADELRCKDQELLKKYDELAQAIFIDMFGDPVKNEKGWDVKRLEEVCSKIGSGSTPRGGKEAYKSNGISLIRSLNIHQNEFKYKDLAFIDDEQAYLLRNVIVEPNDVLFNITGASVCRTTIVPDQVLPARVNQHVAILRLNQLQLKSDYFVRLLNNQNMNRLLYGIATQGGATREAITKEQLEKLEIPIPPHHLQETFAKKIELINQLKEQANAEKSEELFQSLLQRAFKGELVR